ncbi:hypothetical protein ACFJIW_10850 [Tahibacter sp. UC22_41]|uniref:hypothetical protein n=1 Tax=Tahibacter sp. UC22_41 TaxID=3350178 RepID=UPI0036DA840C
MVTILRRVIRRGFAGLFAAALAAMAPMVAAQQALTPHGSFGSWYGHGLAVGDGFAAIGTGSSGGFVDVYRRDGGGWQFETSLLPTDSNAFGYRVALGGGWLAVANRNISASGWPNYIDLFRRDGGNWTFRQRVAMPFSSANSAGYVEKLVVSADALVASTLNIAVEGEIASIRTYAFDFVDGSWGTAQLLQPPYTANFFGESLALSGDLLAVSTWRDRVGPSTGAVSLFRRSGTAWTHVTVVTSPTPAQLDVGASIALCGNRLAVLAQPLPEQPGPVQNRVLTYTGSGPVWSSEGAPLLSPTASPNPQYDSFGKRLACSDSALAMMDSQAGKAAVSLTGPRTVQTLSVALPSHSPGDSIAVHGGDVLVADYMGPLGPPNAMPGIVFAFNGAIDAIFAHGFD